MVLFGGHATDAGLTTGPRRPEGAARDRARGVPVGDYRFWITQAVVAALAAGHMLVQTESSELSTLYVFPEHLFLVPVGYAALNFGFQGAVYTALWATALTLAHVIGMHHMAQFNDAVLELVVLNAMAVFVGQRVDRETSARVDAEHAHVALRASESRYRTLFHTSGEAVLVLDRSGIIHQANETAATLLGRSPSSLAGMSLRELLGPDVTTWIQNGQAMPDGGELVLMRAGGELAYFEPIPTVVASDDGDRLVQLVLRNVTRQRRQREELRTYAGYTLRAHEQERQQLAHELHDEVLQGLMLLVRHLDALDEDLSEVPPAAAARLRTARGAAEALAATVRNFAHQLRPPALEWGLVTCVRLTLDDMAGRTGLRRRFVADGEVRRLADDVELGLFRIAQEALRNIERHARATAVDVTLRFSDQGVMLQVADDGVGFEAEAAQSGLAERQHFGLLGMQERAALLGGRLSVESRPGEGTTVVAVAPAAAAGSSSG